MASQPTGVAFSEVKECPEMLSTVSSPGLEVFQVTTDAESDAHAAAMHSSHALFTPDSTRFVFIRQRGTASGVPGKVEFTLCEIEDHFKLRTLTNEENVRAPVLSLDGKFLYYWVDNTGSPGGALVFIRVSLDDFKTETLKVIDSSVEGVGRPPRGGYMYDGASISQDGRCFSTSASFYTDSDPLFSSLIVDLETGSVRGFQFEPYNWRPFGTYYRGSNPQFFHHLLFGHSHWRSGPQAATGKWYAERADDISRVTLHILSDEGVPLSVVPIGDEGEGVDHACWRGGQYEVVTHTSSTKTAPHWRGIMLSAAPVACAPDHRYLGARIPGARRVELTRTITRPDLCHHSWDSTGNKVVCDTEGWHNNGPTSYLWIGTVREGHEPYIVPKYLLHPQSSWTGSYWTESQPALSPDCRTVFFNSDYLCKPGHPQLFCARGFQFP